MVKEEDLYKPVRKALEEMFSRKGTCKSEVTSQKISDSIKKRLDDYSIFLLETEDKRPDLMGFVHVLSKSGHIDKRLIVVEVKNRGLTLRDIYQVKMYAEIFFARFAFLISPQGFNEARRRLIKNRFLLGYAGGFGSITVMQLLEDNSLKRDEGLCFLDPFYPEN